MNDLTDPADRAFADLLSRARSDRSVLGFVLHGSRVFDGMATAHSDYDVCVIHDETEQGERWQRQKSSGLDIGPATLADFRTAVLDGGDEDRYIYAHAHVLIDRLDGQVEAIIREAHTFPTRSQEMLPGMLDAYINHLYRSIKNWRDGCAVEAHLDAAASMNLALWVIFAMHQRVRPPNKYVIWELQRQPLGPGPWDVAHLLPRVQRILTDGDPDTQRGLFRDVETTARTVGLGEIVDGWGTDLELLHGEQSDEHKHG